MTELTANALQSVLPGQNVLFTEVPISEFGDGIIHREGSGIVTLSGSNYRCPYSRFARYQVFFSANVAIPADGTVSTPVAYAVTINGEPVPTSSMIVTPAAASQFWNISTALFINLPRGCCYTIAVENTGTEASDIQNVSFDIIPA